MTYSSSCITQNVRNAKHTMKYSSHLQVSQSQKMKNTATDVKHKVCREPPLSLYKYEIGFDGTPVLCILRGKRGKKRNPIILILEYGCLCVSPKDHIFWCEPILWC